MRCGQVPEAMPGCEEADLHFLGPRIPDEAACGIAVGAHAQHALLSCMLRVQDAQTINCNFPKVAACESRRAL